MSTTLAGFGLRPKYNETGTVRPRAYYGGIASGYNVALYKYQPVIMNTSGVLIAATTNADIIGVFAGWEGVDATGRMIVSDQWLAGQTYTADGNMVAYVWDDPTTVYQIQADGSLAQSAIGDQADFTTATIGNGSTVGFSVATMSSTLKGAGVQGQLRVIELAPLPGIPGGNSWGDAFTIVHVSIARHEYIANKVAI